LFAFVSLLVGLKAVLLLLQTGTSAPEVRGSMEPSLT